MRMLDRTGTAGVVISVALGLSATSSGQETGRRLALSLDQCVAAAVERNLGLRAEQLDRATTEQNEEGERGVYEPAVVGSVERQANERENTIEESLNQLSSFFDEDNTIYNAALEGLIPSGARYRLGYSLSDLSNNLTNQTVGTPYQNQFNTFAGLTVTQPLLKGAGRTGVQTRLRLAEAESEIARQDLRERLMATIAATEAGYWDVVLTQRELEMRDGSVEIAEKLLEDNRQRVTAGKMSDLEVLQAEAGVATRRARRQEAHHRWVNANNRLLTLLAESVGDSDVVIEAVDLPEQIDPPDDFVASMTRAVQLHPGYLRQLSGAEQDRLRLEYAKNQRWPQLDMVASYGFNGLGDSASESWEDVTGGDFDSWSVGMTLRLPLGGDRRSRSDLEMARLRTEKALVELKATEVELANTVKATLERVRDLHQTIEEHRKVAQFNQRLLDVELQRLDAGKSDSRQVLEVEEDLSEARVDEMKGLVAFRKALVELDLAEGSLLVRLGLEDAEESAGGPVASSSEIVPRSPPSTLSPAPASPEPAVAAEAEVIRAGSDGVAPEGDRVVPRGATGNRAPAGPDRDSPGGPLPAPSRGPGDRAVPR